MSTYIVGDIHGCYDELQQLLKLVDFDRNKDELWVTGDLVARGEKSLETLRFIKQLGSSANIVLGNHDLHLLAIWQGLREVKDKDNVSALLNAPDCDELLNWLRTQSLILRHPEFNFVMVHAGISPQWTIQQAEQLALEVEQQLQGSEFKNLLKNMYSSQPNSWCDSLSGMDRLRFIINAFTRMRYCFLDGSLEFKSKLSPDQTDTKIIRPWFDIATVDDSSAIIFGHWAALLGKTSKSGFYALDTGCVWGHSMTMLRWQDKKQFSLSNPSTN